MAGDVEIVLLDLFGERRETLEGVTSINYARALGYPGSMTLELPVDAYDPQIFEIDSRIEFWRDIGEGRRILDTDAPFFIRRRRRKRSADGEVTLTISGPSAVELCNRRIVNYNAGSAQASKNAPADNMMKAIMRENFGTSASATRQVSAEYLAIGGDFSLGPTVRAKFSRRNVLEVLRDLMFGSFSTGTPTFFDVVRYDQRALLFRTYVGQRGADHGRSSSEPVVFSAEAGNLTEDEFDENYEEEVTFATAGGSGQEADRVTASYNETTRSGRSPFGRREAWVDARDDADPTSLNQDATAAVNEGRPRLTVAGSLQSTEGTRYGKHWGFGDRVVAEIFGFELEVWVSAVAVSITEGGEENVTAKVEGVEVTA